MLFRSMSCFAWAAREGRSSGLLTESVIGASELGIRDLPAIACIDCEGRSPGLGLLSDRSSNHGVMLRRGASSADLASGLRVEFPFPAFDKVRDVRRIRGAGSSFKPLESSRVKPCHSVLGLPERDVMSGADRDGASRNAPGSAVSLNRVSACPRARPMLVAQAAPISSVMR